MPGSRREVKYARDEGRAVPLQPPAAGVAGRCRGSARRARGRHAARGRWRRPRAQTVPGEGDPRRRRGAAGLRLPAQPAPWFREFGLALDAAGRLSVGGAGRLPLQTSHDRVFAGGDNVRGADLVVRAVYDGREAAGRSCSRSASSCPNAAWPEHRGRAPAPAVRESPPASREEGRPSMGKTRLEAFSDGVLAIIITIMVLEMKVPQGEGVDALRPLLPVFLSYVLSFVYVGIYWNNHHHMLHAVRQVDGAALWANLHLLFWLAVPLRHRLDGREPLRRAADGGRWCGAADGGHRLLTAAAAPDRRAWARACAAARSGPRLEGQASPLLYLAAIGLTTWNVWAAQVLYVPGRPAVAHSRPAHRAGPAARPGLSSRGAAHGFRRLVKNQKGAACAAPGASLPPVGAEGAVGPRACSCR